MPIFKLPMQSRLTEYLAAAQPLYRADQVREMDRYAIETLGIAGLELMRRAGAAAFAALRRRWPDSEGIAVLCGAGNNGGDGYVLARLALEAGMEVRVYALANADRMRGDALAACREYLDAGGEVRLELPDRFDPGVVLVDGLLGTGLDRPAEGAYAHAIAVMNDSPSPVLALDIPSGLCADSGNPMGVAVRADVTVTFIAAKRGLHTAEAAEYCGEAILAGLGLPSEVRQTVQSEAALLGCLPSLPPRRRGAHKGRYGHVLVIGGDSGYGGAVRMAAEAAARVGAGLVSIATRASHAAQINLARPELMVHGVERGEQLQALLDKASVVLVGPGLGQSPWAKGLFERAIACGSPTVVDADGLNLLAAQPRHASHWVLTPHPGEAGRLLGKPAAEVQSDRYAAVFSLQKSYGGVAVLKGSGSLILDGKDPVYVCGSGNPGMASGGMGDVLAGVIAGLLAQGVEPLQAAAYGTALHGCAGDLAARQGERGLLAGDLMGPLRELINR